MGSPIVGAGEEAFVSGHPKSLDGRPLAVRLSEHCHSKVIWGCPETGQSQSRNKRLLTVIGTATVRLYKQDRTLINNNSVFVAGHFHSRYVFYLRGLSWPIMRNLRTGL